MKRKNQRNVVVTSTLWHWRCAYNMQPLSNIRVSHTLSKSCLTCDVWHEINNTVCLFFLFFLAVVLFFNLSLPPGSALYVCRPGGQHTRLSAPVPSWHTSSPKKPSSVTSRIKSQPWKKKGLWSKQTRKKRCTKCGAIFRVPLWNVASLKMRKKSFLFVCFVVFLTFSQLVGIHAKKKGFWKRNDL